MNNLGLIYEHSHEIKSNIRDGIIKIYIPQSRFDSKSLALIVSKFKYLIKYKYMKLSIKIILQNIDFKDKITYLMLEALIYDLLKRSNFSLGIYANTDTISKTIHNIGFNQTALYRSIENGWIDKKEFIKNYEKGIFVNPAIYRRFLSKQFLLNLETPSVVYTEIASVLKRYSDDEEWNNSIAQTISELVCNVGSHTEDDCIIDINFGNCMKSADMSARLFINIAVMNFSTDRLFDKIRINLKENRYNYDDSLYNRIYKAYNVHKQYFDNNYESEHFFLITAFQNHVSSRSYKSGMGGTGLTNLIQNIIGKAENDYSYVMSGNHMIFFENEFLNISQDKFIGFNKENDYFNHRPDTEVVHKSGLYVPGTIYQLLIVKEI